MILLCGIPSESPLAMVRGRLEEKGEPYVEFSQRRFGEMDLWFEVADGAVYGELRIGRETFPLESFRAVYTRLMDDRNLPELRGEPPLSPLRSRARGLHQALALWYEVTPARVVNRSVPMGSNSSKPYQAQIIQRHGFRTPETLITNVPDLVREFAAVKGKLIYKSISGVRSIVQTLDEEGLQNLDRIRSCPVQFQEFVEGTNVRVHVVGERVFATAIRTEATDYRYAGRQVGSSADLEEVEISDDLASQCVGLARALQLPFAGIDLKITPSEETVCFEVNPSPAYTYYEANTGQPISQALAEYLANSEVTPASRR